MGRCVFSNYQFRAQLAALAISLFCFTSSFVTAKEPITPTADPINLLENGLEKFYTWSRDTELRDPLHVYTCADGVLQISGESWGGLTTKDEYTNYHMVVEFKWGERTWDDRKERARDSGILVHCTGPDGTYSNTWMAGVEAQIIEGGVGDILVLSTKRKDGTPIPVTLTAEVTKDRDGEPTWLKGSEEKTISGGRINWYGRDPDWEDNIDFRGKDDVESPYGQWTRYEIVCEGDQITTIVNSVVVNHGFDVNPKAGKILVQSEGAEMFVRRWELWPLGKAPTDP